MSDEGGSLVSKARSILEEEGLIGLLKTSYLFTYDSVRNGVDEKYVPKRKQICDNNGVKTPIEYFPLDIFAPNYIPPHHQNPVDNPTYEAFLVEALKEHCSPGDSVVVVGGGLGVTAVTAAQAVGTSGSVQVYEASEEAYNQVRATVSFNNVDDIVDCHHKIVGEPISLSGEAGDAETLLPSELPNADVYELDCEGAELGILKNMTATPNTIIVETHGKFGAPKQEIRGILVDLGYQVIDEKGPTGEVSHITAELSRSSPGHRN